MLSGRLSDQRRQVQDGFPTTAISEVRLNLQPFPLRACHASATAEEKGAFLERNQNGTCTAKEKSK